MPILVVDDENDVRDSICDVLESAGYSVLSASCGEEALGLIEKEDIKLMLVDLSMPGMGGEEFLLEMEARPKKPHALVITALAPWKMLKLMEYGIGYIRKPINNSLLLSAIETLLKKEATGEIKISC